MSYVAVRKKPESTPFAGSTGHVAPSFDKEDYVHRALTAAPHPTHGHRHPMNRDYWDRMADDFKTEIFDVHGHDRKGLVLGKLDQYAAPRKSASDIGCGMGDFLPRLSKRFREVIAVDISPKCIAKARADYSRLLNVSYLTRDLSTPRARLPEVDVALCVNSIITSSFTRRSRILDVVCRHLRRNGHLILVVPSLESALLADVRLIEWNLRNGMSPGAATRAGFPAPQHDDNRRLHQGIVRIDGVETKHYLEEELVVLLTSRGLEVLDIQKIEYPWRTEFESPPRWMKAPFPWDWLCVARKVRRK